MMTMEIYMNTYIKKNDNRKASNISLIKKRENLFKKFSLLKQYSKISGIYFKILLHANCNIQYLSNLELSALDIIIISLMIHMANELERIKKIIINNAGDESCN